MPIIQATLRLPTPLRWPKPPPIMFRLLKARQAKPAIPYHRRQAKKRLQPPGLGLVMSLCRQAYRICPQQGAAPGLSPTLRPPADPAKTWPARLTAARRPSSQGRKIPRAGRLLLRAHLRPPRSRHSRPTRPAVSCLPRESADSQRWAVTVHPLDLPAQAQGRRAWAARTPHGPL